jgi:hypothetical protein
MQSHIIVKNLEAQAEALKLARGCYQYALLTGGESLSGSTLRGKAANFSSRYKMSRENLISRCISAGIKISETTGNNNKRILVIG